jgi:uncharacterized protein (DUF2147 family)
MMPQRFRVPALFIPLSLLGLSTAARAAPNVLGNWILEDRTAVITIASCGRSVCGRISKALVHKPGHPDTDVKNPDPALRKKPLIGLQILGGFVPKGNRWESGRIYDPESGRSYRSRLGLNSDGSLKVSGCIVFFCQSQRWTRSP